MATSLGNLLLGAGVDTTSYYSQLEGMRRDALRIGQDIDRTLGAIGRNKLIINTDDSALTRLNQHFDLKAKHHRQLQQTFDLNPLKVSADTSELERIKDGYASVSAAQERVRVANSSSGFSSSGSAASMASGKRTDPAYAATISGPIVAELKSIRGDLKGLRQQVKTNGKGPGAMKMIQTGLFEGIGQDFGIKIGNELQKSAKKQLGKDVIGQAGKAFDFALDPKRFDGFEEKLIDKLEDYYVYTPKAERAEKFSQYVEEFTAPLRGQVASVTGQALRVGTYPAKIRKKVNLARSAELSKRIAKDIEVPDIEGIENIENIALISGGLDYKEGGLNTYLARNLSKGILGKKTATVPSPNVYTNEKVFGDLHDLRTTIFKAISDMQGGNDDTGLAETIPLDKLLHVALEAGFNPDAVLMEASRLAYEEKYPGKKFIFGGTSGGSTVAEEAVAISERAGASNVKGFGATFGHAGLTNTATSENYQAFVGSLDPLFLQNFGTGYVDEDKLSKGQRRIYEGTLAASQLPKDFLRGVMTPADNTTVIPNVGDAHHLGQFMAAKETQKKMQEFLGLDDIDPSLTGKQGTKAFKVYSNMFAQYESLDRTFRSLDGDKDALAEIERGDFSFTLPDGRLRKTYGQDQEKFDLEYAAEEFSVARVVKGQAAKDGKAFGALLHDLAAALRDVESVDGEKIKELSNVFRELFGKAPSIPKSARAELKALAQNNNDFDPEVIGKRTIPTLKELEKQRRVEKIQIRMPLDLDPEYHSKDKRKAELVRIDAANSSDVVLTPAQYIDEQPPRKGVGGLVDRAKNAAGSSVVGQMNKLLAQIPGQRDVIDNNPRQISRLEDLTLKDYIHMSQIGGEDVAGLFASAYGAAQGVEGATLGMIPFGPQIKGIGKNIALPAATFAAASSLPGGHMAQQALSGAMETAIGLPAGALAEAISGTASGAITEAIGSLPLLGPKLAPALAEGFTSLIQSGAAALAGGAAAAATPVVGGQALIGAAKGTANFLIPGASNRETRAKLSAAKASTDIKMLKHGADMVKHALPYKKSDANRISGTLQKEIPAMRARIDEAIGLLTPVERMGTREGAQLANAKSQLSKQESKLSELVKGLKKMTTNPVSEMNRAVKGGDYIDVEVIEEYDNLLNSAIPQKMLGAAKDTPSVKISTIQNQIKAMGKAFAAQGKEIAYRIKQDPRDIEAIQGSQDLLDSVEIARDAIDVIMRDANAKESPALRKAAKTSRGQITKSANRVRNYAKDAEGIGSDVGLGISKGLIDRIGDTEKTARALAKGVIEVTKDEFEIKSPSRVMERIAKNVVAGFDLGLKGLLGSGDIVGNLVSDMTEKFPEFAETIESVGLGVKTLFASFVGFAGIKYVGGMLTDFAVGAIDVAIEFEKIAVKLKFIENSATSARSSMARLIGEAKELGSDAREDLAGYTQIQAASKDTSLEGYGSQSLFEAGRQASIVYQLGGEEQGRVFKAFEQMISKGNISAEELRQQLGEVLPGAFQVAARSIGVTTAELNKMLSRGEVLSSEFLPKFAQQLSAETASGLAGAAETTQASLNRLNTAMIELQSQTGTALLPFKKATLKGAADSVDFLSDNMRGLLSVALTLAASAAWPFIQKALVGASTLLRGLPGLLRGTASGIIAMQATLVRAAKMASRFAVQMIAIELAIGAARVAWQIFNVTGGEGTAIAEGAAKSFDKLIEKLAGVKEAADGAKASLKAEGFIGELDSKGDGIVKLVDGMTNSIYKMLGLTEGRFSREGKKSPFDYLLGDPQIKRQQAKRVEDGESLRSTTRKTLELSESYLSGKNRPVLDERLRVDNELQTIKQKQQALKALRPGSVEELAMLVEQEEILLRARGKSIETIQSIRSAIDTRVTNNESRLKALSEDYSNGAISLDLYNSEVKKTKADLFEAKKAQESWNDALGATTMSLTQLSRALADISVKLSDANLLNEFQTTLYKSDVARAQANGATQGEVTSANAAIEQSSIAAQIANNRAAVEQTKALLASAEVASALRDAGISDYSQAGPADVAKKLEYIDDTSPRLKFSLEAVQQLQELERTANELGGEFAQNAADVAVELREVSKSINEFFKDIREESQRLSIEAKSIRNESALSKMKADIQQAMIGFSKSFINDFGSSLIGIIEAFNEPLQNALSAQESIMAAQQEYFASAIQSRELKKQLPGVQGMEFSQYSSGGGAGNSTEFIGLMGSTGHSTGSHAHMQAQGGEHLDLHSVNERFRFDGKPATPYSVTDDEHDHAARGSRGIDIAMPEGTKMSAIGVSHISDTHYDERSGYYNIVTFEDGFEVLIAHQLPPIKGTGHARSPSQAPARTMTQPSSMTGSTGNPLMDGLSDRFSDPTIAAALYGNFMQESQGDSAVINSIGASGIAQWLGDRKTKLIDFAAQMGKSWTDLNVQLDFVQKEFQGSEAGAWSKIQNASGQGLEATTLAVRRYYERPGEHEANDQARLAYAKEMANAVPSNQFVNAQDPRQTASAQEYDQFRRNEQVRISEADLNVSQNLNEKIGNIESQLGAQNALSDVQAQMQQQSGKDQLVESRRNMADQNRQGNRSVIDLQFEAMEATPDTALKQQMEELRRRYEDDSLGLSEFVTSIGATIDQASMFIDAIGKVRVSNGGILPDDSADALIQELQLVVDDARPALSNAESRLSQIGSLYEQLNQKAMDESERARLERAFEIRQQTTGLENESLRAAMPQTKRAGWGDDVIRGEFDIGVSELELDFDGKVRELQELERQGLRTEEEVASLTNQYEELAAINFLELQQGMERNLEILREAEDSAVFDRKAQLGESILQRFSLFGGAPVTTEDGRNYEREFALVSQQRAYEAEADSFRQEAADSGYDPDTLARTLALLEQINNVKLGSIKAEFHELKPAFDVLRGSTTSLFEDWLIGAKSMGEAFQDFTNSVITGIAQIAAQKLSEALFGLFVGGGSGGGGLTSLLGSIFNFKDGGEVPNFSSGGIVPITGGNNGYGEGYGNLSKALKREGPLGRVVVASANERILSIAETKRYHELGLDKVVNYMDGGIVGATSSKVAFSGKMQSGAFSPTINVNVPVTMGGDGQGNSEESASRLSESLQRAVRGAVIATIEEEQRPRGILSR